MRISVVLLVVLFISACASASSVHSTVTVFHSLPTTQNGKTIGILPVDQTKENTLEFRDYAGKLAGYLELTGYRVVPIQDLPDYLAFFGYGIDDGTLVSQSYTIPIIGVTGSSGSTTTGTVTSYGNMSVINATTTNTPTYGLTGYRSGTVTHEVYRRVMILNILDSTKIIPGDDTSTTAARIYEATLISSGSCRSIAGVIDELLAGMFEEFPGESGRVRTVSVPFTSDSC